MICLFLYCYNMLLTLTENYCSKYRVSLVPSKTKLLGFCPPKMRHLLDIAQLSNMIKINDQKVDFGEETEHVGITRNISGNLPHIMNRIAAYKTTMASVLPAGLAKSHHGNPAAALRVHQLYAIPRFFLGLAALVLTESEVKLVDQQHHRMLERIQKLHERTPRCFVYLTAGTIPGRALLHQKQLSLFMMICHLPGNPINDHARAILTSAPKSCKSWFLQIRDLCLMYRLAHPLHLLEHPPTKKDFKSRVKKAITEHWEQILCQEAVSLPSLKFFAAGACSLSTVHPVWLAAGSNSFENRKTEILVKMASGRMRTEYLSRHWSDNRHGYCQANTCHDTVGDLEHLLIHCPAMAEDRERLWNMCFIKGTVSPRENF